MDTMPQRHAYKCLPLQIANAHGWELLCPYAIEATWNGGRRPGDIVIESSGPPDDQFAQSRFGAGILTFAPGIMLRTDDPLGLYVTGPINVGKDGIFPLTAIAETSWLPAPMPMNWKFTRSGIPARFEKGEPFAHFFPLALAAIEEMEPAWRDILDEPDLLRQFEQWRATRAFANLAHRHDGTRSTFYRHYRQGTLADGTPVTQLHRTRIAVRPFADVVSDRGPERLTRGLQIVNSMWYQMREADRLADYDQECIEHDNGD